MVIRQSKQLEVVAYAAHCSLWGKILFNSMLMRAEVL